MCIDYEDSIEESSSKSVKKDEQMKPRSKETRRLVTGRKMQTRTVGRCWNERPVMVGAVVYIYSPCT